MLNKIALGTANFTQSYGILSQGVALDKNIVKDILETALTQKITILDTALGYGDLTKKAPISLLKQFQIVTKISVLENPETLFKKMFLYKDLNLYGLLIHDPQNLPGAKPERLGQVLDKLRREYAIKKIGISVYDLQDVKNFENMCKPDLIQIPLNPLNQLFNQGTFKEYVKRNDIEVHARSLFLQGVLLADQLPEKLKPLETEWLNVKNSLKSYASPLHGILRWALNQEWVSRWVLGVSSLNNLEEIIRVINSISPLEAPPFKHVQHSLIDPRNWRKKC